MRFYSKTSLYSYSKLEEVLGSSMYKSPYNQRSGFTALKIPPRLAWTWRPQF